jgi:hypothetical protein
MNEFSKNGNRNEHIFLIKYIFGSRKITFEKFFQTGSQCYGGISRFLMIFSFFHDGSRPIKIRITARASVTIPEQSGSRRPTRSITINTNTNVRVSVFYLRKNITLIKFFSKNFIQTRL